MRIAPKPYRTLAGAAVIVAASWLSTTTATGQAPAVGKDCSAAIGGTRTVNGRTIGPNKCEILQESQVKNAAGAPFRRLDIAVSGCIEGYTPKVGPPRHPEIMQFTDVPEYSLAQEGNLGPYYHGVSCYSGSVEKSGLTALFPADPKDWNGKLYMLFHGGSPYVPFGDLLPRKAGEYAPLAGASAYASLMIDKGYAVVYTRRSSHSGGEGDMGAILDTGSELGGKSHKFHLGLLRDWTEIAKNLVETNLRSRPTRTYWYGRSGGAAPGRLFNYIPGANVDSKGRKLFDAFIVDDSAGGWYMPTMYFTRKEVEKGAFAVERSDKDHLVFDEAHRKAFAPQIEVAHLGYSGNDFVEASYQVIKRRNARFLLEKGLTDKTRHYEIAAVSHGDAGAVYPNKLWEENLDLTGFFDATIDNIDRWVELGIAPAATRSDVPLLGDANRDGVVENPAIELPEVACPIGVYYEYPPGVKSAGRTGFAPYLRETRPALNSYTTQPPPGYDPAWLEPLNNYGHLLDMNGNGVRDTRESIEEAWQRREREGQKYGTLKPGEKFTRARYLACVAQVATDLYKDGLLSEVAMLHYLRFAAPSDLPTEP
jgi:hypothetical protein